ncbi:neuroguidin-like [Lytechinus variegatus]|uniref:neuroguidin-like n=1 Tax=Lytechinus variegatus TaxID=7654 RepID=UPI001BB23C11|nr:neuroguidin-like [Lytechinus variegatus]
MNSDDGGSLNVPEAELLQFKTLLKGLLEQVSGVTKSVKGIQKKVEDGVTCTAKGVSFLEVKHHLLLSYIMDLTYIMLQKVKGQSINGDPAVLRLAENRTVLEKMRPIDQKLTYQIDKLIKTASTGVPAANDPLRFKPNPDGLISKLQDEEGEEDSDEDEEEKIEKPKKYVPPKVAAMYYDGDETQKERRERQLEKAKKRALSSEMIRELRAEYYDGPEEVRESRSLHRLKEDKEAREKNEFEEENFMRLPVTKKDKQRERNMTTMASLDALTRFDNISVLDRDIEGDMDGPPRKKGKLSSKLRKANKRKAAKALKRRKKKF